MLVVRWLAVTDLAGRMPCKRGNAGLPFRAADADALLAL
jgi:hypothetical protein